MSGISGWYEPAAANLWSCFRRTPESGAPGAPRARRFVFSSCHCTHCVVCYTYNTLLQEQRYTEVGGAGILQEVCGHREGRADALGPPERRHVPDRPISDSRSSPGALEM